LSEASSHNRREFERRAKERPSYASKINGRKKIFQICEQHPALCAMKMCVIKNTSGFDESLRNPGCRRDFSNGTVDPSQQSL